MKSKAQKKKLETQKKHALGLHNVDFNYILKDTIFNKK